MQGVSVRFLPLALFISICMCKHASTTKPVDNIGNNQCLNPKTETITDIDSSLDTSQILYGNIDGNKYCTFVVKSDLQTPTVILSQLSRISNTYCPIKSIEFEPFEGTPYPEISNNRFVVNLSRVHDGTFTLGYTFKKEDTCFKLVHVEDQEFRLELYFRDDPSRGNDSSEAWVGRSFDFNSKTITIWAKIFSGCWNKDSVEWKRANEMHGRGIPPRSNYIRKTFRFEPGAEYDISNFRDFEYLKFIRYKYDGYSHIVKDTGYAEYIE